MVKAQDVDPMQLIKEDERIEQMFRQQMIKTKKLQVNDKQYRNRLIDLLDVFVTAGRDNKDLLRRGLVLYSDILNKICLTIQYQYLNGNRLISLLSKLLKRIESDMEEYQEELDALVKTIFNIFVYKRAKSFVNDLLVLVLQLLSAKSPKLERVVARNLEIVIVFIEKGKEIDKVFFTLKKILLKSSFCFQRFFTRLCQILSTSKNSFFVEYFLKTLVEVFTAKSLEAKFLGRESLQGNVDCLEAALLKLIEGMSEKDEASDKKVKMNKRQVSRILDNMSEMPGVKLSPRGVETGRLLKQGQPK